MSASNIAAIVVILAFQVAIAELCGLYISDWRWWIVSGLFVMYGATRGLRSI